MQKTSYKTLAESRTKLESILAEFGLEIGSDSWLNRAYHVASILSKIYQDDAAMEDFRRRHSDGEIYFALYDIALLYDILPFMQTGDSDVMKSKLRKILHISSPPRETLENNEARNTFWELALLSHLKRSNIQAVLGNPNPDILAHSDSRKYYIQCKRLYSPHQRALRRNIKEAVEQLRSDLLSENNDAFGVLALSVERPLTEGRLMLVTDSEQSARESLRAALNQFKLEHGHIWLDPDVIQDSRIVAIMLNLVVPGIIENQNIFVTGSQMDMHNTWVGSSGFKTAVEDFGPLKQVLEY